MQQIKEEQINFLLEDIEKKIRSVQETNRIKRQPTRWYKNSTSSGKKNFDSVVQENKH